jgi:hypothetical protein
VLIISAMIWTSIGALAQTAGTSRATGVVQDVTGAIVPDAKVVLTIYNFDDVRRCLCL